MILYQIKEGEARILSYRSYDEEADIPSSLGGCPVTELAPYAFSVGYGKEKMLKEAERTGAVMLWDAWQNSEEPELCGPRLKSIVLPDTLRTIGNYGFYHCENLTDITCSSSIEDLGAGLFTGCTRVARIRMRIETGKKSCLKEMLSELRQELCLTYETPEGTAELIFPEYYEDAVENTPARIIMREVHGSGLGYRYCFLGTEFRFQEYDSLFPAAKAQETERLAARMAVRRLRYPLGLQSCYQAAYEAYIMDQRKLAAAIALEEQKVEELTWLVRTYVKTKEELEAVVELANRRKDPEALSVLMEERHRRFPAKRNSFSL